MQQVKETRTERVTCFVMFCLILGFYVATRPFNQAESYDSINYALFAENFPLGTAPDARNILFHAFNRAMFVALEWLGLGVRGLELIVSISLVTGAASLVLFARLMKRGFGVSSFSAWMGAMFLGLTYGFWRYAGAAEVYIPSIFLILCSLTFIFKFLDDENKNYRTLFVASIFSGVAVLYYNPNAIALFIAMFILFCSRSRFFSFVRYSVVGALVVVAGIVASFVMINGSFPSPEGIVDFLGSRNGEFRDRPSLPTAIVKSVLAFGHDVYAAHWTRTLDPVRTALDPFIPGCIYNFNVVVFAGKGIQSFTAIAAILLLPIALVILRIHWLASQKWKFSRPSLAVCFLLGWFALMVLIVGTIDPGSFEAWIPALVPLAGLLTVLVIEPCYQTGNKRILLIFLLLTLAYNFFGGAMIWRNNEGDIFFHKTAWIRQELNQNDTVLLNEFDYRVVDYLNYYSDARVANLTESDRIIIFRSHPEIRSVSIDEFMASHKKDKFRLFVMDDVLSPPTEIKSCRYGEARFEAALGLAKRLNQDAVLVNSDAFGKTYQIKPSE